MANLKDFTTDELTQELVRRLQEKKYQVENDIEEMKDAMRGLDLAKKLCEKQKA